MEINLRIIKLVNKNEKYVDKKGKEHCCVNYYLAINDNWVPIRPSFSKGYFYLDSVAEFIVNGDSNGKED